MRCPETRSVAAYVLGALDPSEQLELEWHLTSCESCRQELVEIAHLPGLMHRLSLDDVTQQTLPEATTVEASAVLRRPRSQVLVLVLVLAMIIVLVLAVAWWCIRRTGGAETAGPDQLHPIRQEATR